MFLGHIAVGFAAKPLARTTSLGWLIAAPIVLDLLWPFFLVAGWERVRIDPGNTAFTPLDFVHYPYTHSLLMSVMWGLIFGGLFLRITDNGRAAWVIIAGVISHWVLDWVTHGEDLPLYPGSEKFGLSLWNSVPATVAVEIAMYVIGIAIYIRTTRALDRKGTLAFWGFVAFLGVIYAANMAGPPPPNVATIEIAGFAMSAIPIWAAWFDRHRRLRNNP